jgi:hypothetical protein
MDFGTPDETKCGICGTIGEYPYAWRGEDGDEFLVEDPICEDCDEIYEYDEDEDAYVERDV